MGIVQSFEQSLGFWAEAAVNIGKSLPRKTRIIKQGSMGYGLQATAPIERGRKVVAYLLTGLSYIDPLSASPVVYSFDLPLVESCGPAVERWMQAAHRTPWKIHNTRVGMKGSELHDFLGMVLTDCTSGHSKDIDDQARRYLDAHNMAGCFCNHSNDPNATISWTSVSAIDAPLCALVPTIVALRRIEAGEFVMLNYGMNYNLSLE